MAIAAAPTATYNAIGDVSPVLTSFVPDVVVCFEGVSGVLAGCIGTGVSVALGVIVGVAVGAGVEVGFGVGVAVGILCISPSFGYTSGE